MKNKLNKKLHKLLPIFLSAAILFVFATAVCNIIVIAAADDYVIRFDEAVALGDVDCILVLGAGIKPDGSLSNILHERVLVAAELYFAGASQRILVSGDNSREDYNEPDAMKGYMIGRGIDEKLVFADYAGFDTYDSVYRAKEIFKAEKIIIVTQDFHISRAVFIARALGLEAYGVACDTGRLGVSLLNETRETAARAKYTLDAIFKPKPHFLGDEIPING